MNKKITTKEIVVVAMVAAVVGVIYTLLDYAYMPMSAVLGTVFMELTFGIYMLSGALPMYLVRKPGIAFFGALVTAGESASWKPIWSAVSSGRRFRGSWSRDSICYFQA